MFSFLGKVLIVAAFCFQAWLLHSNTVIAAEFNTKLTAALATCKDIPTNISAHLIAHGRHIVMGLFASSALMLISRCWLFKVFVLLGLAIQFYLEHAPLKGIPSLENTALWTQVALMGGIIYLMGVDCCAAGACVSRPSENKAAPKQSNQETAGGKKAKRA